MKERIFVCLVCLLLLIKFKAASQTIVHKLTLKQAVDSALNNNLQIRQSDFQMQAASINLRQAKANLLPNLFGNIGQGINQGRSIDPFTNSYINQQIAFGNYSVSSSVTLFSGFQLLNLIKQNALDFQAGKMDLQQTKDNVMLNVILAYLQIENNEEQLTQSQTQASVTSKQVNRLETMNEAGAIAPALLYDLKGQLAEDELTIVTNQNNLNGAKLSLAQLMNVPYQSDLQVEKMSVDTLALEYGDDPAALYNLSVKELAIVKAAELRRQSAERSVKVARAYYYPTVSLSGSYNTNYSNAATQDIVLGTVEVPSEDYVNVSGSKIPVTTKRTNFETKKINFSDQFNNNYNTSVFLSVQIPILNGFRAKNQVALAKIRLKNAEAESETIKPN